MAAPSASKGTEESNPLANALAGVVLATLPAFLLAAVLWWGLRRRLGRAEALTIAATGAIGFGLHAKANAVAWFDWMTGPLQGVRGFADVAWVPLLTGTALLLGLMLLLEGTALAAKMPLPRRATAPASPIQGDESLLPDDAQREAIQVAAPPTVMVSPDDHSLLNDTAPTNRFIPLGVDINGTPSGIYEDELVHGVIFGASGSGKSVSLQALMGALLDLGWDGAMIDLKEDAQKGGMRDWCHDYAVSHAIPYQEMRLSTNEPTSWFNPFEGLSADEARDMIVLLTPGDDQFWSNLSTQMVGQAVRLLFDAHKVDPTRFPFPSPFDLGMLMRQGAQMPKYTQEMRAAVLQAMPERSKEDFFSLSNPSQDEAKNAVGFAAKLTTIYQTEAGRLTLRPTEGVPTMNITQGGLTYIGLDSQGKPDLTGMVSTSLLQRVSVWAAQRNVNATGPLPHRFIIIDEANWVNRKIISNLLSRARSSRLHIILATQGPLDWEVAQTSGQGQGVAGFNAMAQNVTFSMIMRQGEPKSAQICAEYLGQRTVMRATQRVTDDGLVDASARSEMDYVVQPDELRRMRIGEALIMCEVPRERIFYTKIARRDPRAVVRRTAR